MLQCYSVPNVDVVLRHRLCFWLPRVLLSIAIIIFDAHIMRKCIPQFLKPRTSPMSRYSSFYRHPPVFRVSRALCILRPRIEAYSFHRPRFHSGSIQVPSRFHSQQVTGKGQAKSGPARPCQGRAGEAAGWLGRRTLQFPTHGAVSAYLVHCSYFPLASPPPSPSPSPPCSPQFSRISSPPDCFFPQTWSAPPVTKEFFLGLYAIWLIAFTYLNLYISLSSIRS